MKSTCPGRPGSLLTFAPVVAHGRTWYPRPGNKHSLILLKRKTPKQVSFVRAYRGWRASGAREEGELGEGRAFLRWLQKHQLSIQWTHRDFMVHPLFAHRAGPRHDANDEMAQGLSFAIRPVTVGDRNIKLYIPDEAMLSLIGMPYGDEEDFLELVKRYIARRFQWESWRAPAPTFLDWTIAEAKRPVFEELQVGFYPLL